LNGLIIELDNGSAPKRNADQARSDGTDNMFSVFGEADSEEPPALIAPPAWKRQRRALDSGDAVGW